MGIAAVKAEMELEQWKQLILDRENGGKTIKEWCAGHNISMSAYYYRLRMLRENAYAHIQARPSRHQLPMAASEQAPSANGWAMAVAAAAEIGERAVSQTKAATAARQCDDAHESVAAIMTVRIGKAEIDIRQGCDPNLFRTVCSMLVGL